VVEGTELPILMLQYGGEKATGNILIRGARQLLTLRGPRGLRRGADLNEIGGRNAIGRIDLVENRFVGMKSRGAYETPGGTLLYAAHRELESLCLDREVQHFKQHIGLKYAEVVYFGLWFTPLREALSAFVTSTQKTVTGKVRLKLYKGNVIVVGRDSKTDSLFDVFAGGGHGNRHAEGGTH